MIKSLYEEFIFLSFLLFFVNTYSQKKASVEDFVAEHQGLEENESGEITPINDREINKKIRFFIEERFVNVSYSKHNLGQLPNVYKSL